MKQREASILFLGKSSDDHTHRALSFCRNNFTTVASHLGRFGQGGLPANATSWEGDYIISYLSPWLVPEILLKKAKLAAINFHPASPEYPGIGCTNFALYDNAKEYGATCHHMTAEADAGTIVAVKRFPVFETDSVTSLLSRTHDHQLSLFYDIISLLINNDQLPVSEETWSRKPFTRKELNALARLTTDMTKEEVKRRVRATAFGTWQPVIEIHGFPFALKLPDNE